MNPVSSDSAAVLLHQFSEWLDRPYGEPFPLSLSHEDLVRMFLADRRVNALPALSA